jgi:copper transport protein
MFEAFAPSRPGSVWYRFGRGAGHFCRARTGGTVYHRSFRSFFRTLTLTLILMAAISAVPVSAHPELVRANPAPDALLVAPTQQIELWFSERIDLGAGSPQVELVDESGARTLAEARIDPNDPYHVIAEIDALDFGTWTVAWQVRSLDDGHTLTGSYAFRIGGANRAPGAATTEGERPQTWNVLTRWTTFLGASLAVGAAGLALLAHGRLISRPAMPILARAKPAAVAGSAIATIATLAEPLLLSRFPPANSLAPTLQGALETQHNAWLMRAIALVASLVLASVALVVKRNDGVSIAAGIAALVGIFGLSMTGHAAAREYLRPLAIGVDAIHQFTIAGWIGILLLLVLSWRTVNREQIDRFSHVALPLMLVGILTGVGNSIFVLPELSALWTSDYGRVIIAKLVFLAGVLALAVTNRSLLMRATTAGADYLRRLRVPMRAEALLALIVVLGGSGLALLATPTVAEVSTMTSLGITHYSAPAPRDERLLVTLHLAPAKPGVNDVGVSVADLDANPLPDEAIQRITVDFESLTSLTSQTGAEAIPGENGIWTVQGLHLSIADWWRITVHVRRAGLADATSEFFVVLPDPNIFGFPDSVESTDDPAARALFDQGLTSLTTLHRVSYTQQLSSGSPGMVVLSQARVNDGFDGSTPSQTISTEQTTSITIGTTRWLSQTSSNRWGATQSNPPIPPFEWGDEYVAAQGFRLGAIEEVNGETAQIVTFYTPQTNLTPAFYAWWVSLETGELLKIAMASRVHYMTQVFSDFDGDIVIEPPVNPAGTPVATPGLDISNLGG